MPVRFTQCLNRERPRLFPRGARCSDHVRWDLRMEDWDLFTDACLRCHSTLRNAKCRVKGPYDGLVAPMRVGEKSSLCVLSPDEQMFCKYSLYCVD